MRYIRTKDGIYESDKVSFDEKFVYKYEVRPIWQINQEQEEIIKQADTIEELCDEFVIVVENDDEHYIETARYGLNMVKTRLPKEQKFDLHGAIWTDKGLIYVAKMNDKGELELL